MACRPAVPPSKDEKTLAAIRLKVKRIGLDRRDVQKLVDEARGEAWENRYKKTKSGR